MKIRILDNLPVGKDGNHVSFRALRNLPSGAITPKGWLHEQFRIALSGMPGTLWKYSRFLEDGNGWLNPEKTEFENDFQKPWEEGACWLRYFVSLAAVTKKWVEILPEGPWNYGLMTDREFTVKESPMPQGKGVFNWNQAPLAITAHARRIPSWKLQDHMVAPLQNSPVRSSEPDELIALIPMGCARLRLSVFPVVSDAAWASDWREIPETTPLEDRPKGREIAF